MTEPGDEREELRPHVRSEQLRSDAVVVVRGGPDDAVKLAAHARRTNRAFALDGVPLWGVSVFAALDDLGPASLDGILAGRMMTYRLVHLPTAGALIEAGFALLPTFGRPHLTVALGSDGAAEIRRLLDALGPPQTNPYHGGGQRRRR
jgi:hypothetical protein